MRFVINVAISCRRGNYVEWSEIPFEITLVSRTEQSNSCRDSAMSASMHPSCSDSSWFYIFNNVSGARDIKLRTLTLITPSCFYLPSSFRRLFHNLPVIPFEIATICFVSRILTFRFRRAKKYETVGRDSWILRRECHDDAFIFPSWSRK